MLEGMVPVWKRALVVVVVLGALFFEVQSVFAGAVFPPDGPPDGFTPPGTDGGFPIGGPGTFPVGGNGGGNTTGGPNNGSGPVPNGSIDPLTGQPISETTQTVEQPPVTVDHGSCQWDSVQGGLYCLVISGFGSFASIAGWLFDFAVREFIVGFGTLYLNTGIGVILENLWGTVRDIFNLTFIFGLVYIGFQIILGVNEAGAKRTIPYLILAALLVNFSLFIVKFIIDFTNYAAAQIYQLFRSAGNTSGVEISNAFLNAIDFSSILGAQGQDAPFMLIIGTLFLFLVLFYVFLSGAILIMIRFIALCFYMIFSPIMFLGWVFPGMGSYTKDFWRGLLGQAFFAPSLLFLLYLSISVIKQFRAGFKLTLAAENVGTGSTATITEFLNLIPFFVLSIGFIIASLVVAKKIGFTGGGMAIAMAEKARGKMQGYVGGAAFGAAAMAGRNTVGVAADKMQNSDRVKDWAARNGRFGKMMYSGVGKVADSSMDVRKVGGLGKQLGVGEGRKGGITTIAKEQKKSDEEFLKAIGTRDFDNYDPRAKQLKAQMSESENAVLEVKKQIAEAYRTGNTQDIAFLQLRLAEAEGKYANHKSEYDAQKKTWTTMEEYGRQLGYIENIEKWQRRQKYVTGGAAILAAGVATAGVGLGAGVAAGGAAGLVARRYGYSNKKAASGLRKDYGKDGAVKKKKDAEEKKIKETLAAAGYKNEEHHPPAQSSAAAPAASTHAAAAPAPKASGGGGGHDHHPTVH